MQLPYLAATIEVGLIDANGRAETKFVGAFHVSAVFLLPFSLET